MTFSRLPSLVLASLMLSACMASTPRNVPVTMMGTQGMGTVNQMTARAGATPEQISKQTGLDISTLLEMNGLLQSQQLTPGQKLNLPVPSTIHVIEGDSIDTIAKAFGVSRDDIIRENDLKPPFILSRGQSLKMPQTAKAETHDDMDELPPLSITNDTAPVVPSSPITTSDTGSTKVHSSAAGTIVEEDLAPPPGAAVVKQEPAPVIALTEPTPLMKPAPKTQTLGTGMPSFSWPLNGSVLSGYGPQSDGRHNDGLNIGAPSGTAVRAAAPGEVVYTGDNVAGFGNLVLIRHSGGFATAYAHVQSPLVKRGDRVDAGQAIAQVGKTGNVSSPQLHFEIRKGTQPVDPETYLP
jgi:murein DD-endopeptidase MepM/ murein hydrolase activator NlpD